MLLVLLLGWIVVSIGLAFGIARLARNRLVKPLLFLSLAPLLAVLPLIDEIIGKLQFDRLCKEAEEVRIYGTIPVGEELYFPDGHWRLASSPPLSFEDFKRVRQNHDSLVRYESTELQSSGIAIHISGSETRVLDRNTGRALASYRIFGTRGGWISQNFEKPIIVRDQCLPQSFDGLGQRIFPYRKAGGNK